ncbi:hypothetical protein PHYPSEUDO_012394 [Phytophthora pseudosyringae]|uniref:Uncharacterized protein n=1 Tax=Phytophthora pseudosyringae TaxID=221518 RepID=A0A8T1VA10_9STRA|nr:hypothetical protein PHYPSEUDO_012394 [Phytophthora pseudosyringae]
MNKDRDQGGAGARGRSCGRARNHDAGRRRATAGAPAADSASGVGESSHAEDDDVVLVHVWLRLCNPAGQMTDVEAVRPTQTDVIASTVRRRAQTDEHDDEGGTGARGQRGRRRRAAAVALALAASDSEDILSGNDEDVVLVQGSSCIICLAWLYGPSRRPSLALLEMYTRSHNKHQC